MKRLNEQVKRNWDRFPAEVGRIDVPERPLQLLFGGKDERTLFILTHHAPYSALP